MTLDFLHGKKITEAFYAPDKQVVTLLFDDETLYGWACDVEGERLSDCGSRTISFSEVDRINQAFGIKP